MAKRKPINTIEEFREAVRDILAERIGGKEVADVIVARPDLGQLFNMSFSMNRANPRAHEVAANTVIDGLATHAARQIVAAAADAGKARAAADGIA